MLSKTQSISVRLSADDYAYLMKIDRNGAVTQSEKVRELIALARDTVGTESFTRAYMAATETLLPFKAQYKESPEQQSALIECVFELITDAVASIQSTAQSDDFNQHLEARLIPSLETLVMQLKGLAHGHGQTLHPERTTQLLTLLRDE